MQVINENDFKVKQLTEWGFKSSHYILDEDRVDIKLDYVWIETKQKSEDIYDMLAQVIFTAYKVKGYRSLPFFFGCFNSEKGAIIENHQAQEVFAHTDINWTQTPSKLDQKTIDRIKFLIKSVQEYNLVDLGKKLHEIEEKSILSQGKVHKNNFIIVYNEWLEKVGNDIESAHFETGEISKADCFLADLMTNGKKSIADKLRIVSKTIDENKCYVSVDKTRLFSEIQIKNQKAYANFWSKYERPPADEFQEQILSRRDLLQPHEVREIKGAFFTPKVWSNISKEYLAKALGENWQDEYYIWDCCCGTGNLERGLVNQDRVYMSTLDLADIAIMDQTDFMPDSPKFRFDFLNDPWLPKAQGGEIPDGLWKIIKETPQKLIIYMNPPYLEVGNAKQNIGTGEARTGATTTDIKAEMKLAGFGKASNELFMQFYYRIWKEIPNVKIGSFSTLKNCISPNFEAFRNQFKAKFCGGFVCKADTFDNVKGKFPISFQIWDCEVKEDFPKQLEFDVWEQEKVLRGEEPEKAEMVSVKSVVNFESKALINSWFKTNNKSDGVIGAITKNANDFQNQNTVALFGKPTNGHYNANLYETNLIQGLVYVAVRLCIPATWLNDRDQFTAPRKAETSNEIFNHKEVCEYESDGNFINNCIVFALFEKNNTNWQIFPNSQIGVNGVERDMKIYNMLLKGKVFSAEAEAVLEVARKIYVLYNSEFKNPNASWYDVCKELRASRNITYGELRAEFLKVQGILALEIASDVYKYGFLMG